MLLSGLSLAASGVLVFVVAEAAARGSMGVNGAAGIRLPSLMASQEAWKQGHRRARIPLDVGGLILVAGGLVAAFSSSAVVSNVSILVSMIAALVAIGVGTGIAVRAARRVSRGGE